MTPGIVQELARLNGWELSPRFDLADISPQRARPPRRCGAAVLAHAVFYRRRGAAIAVVSQPHRQRPADLWNWVQAARALAEACGLDCRFTPNRGALMALVRPGTATIVWPDPHVAAGRR